MLKAKSPLTDDEFINDELGDETLEEYLLHALALQGAEPLCDPMRLLAPCESCKGIAKLLDVTRKVALEGKLTVQFNHTGRTWKAIGDNGSWYDSAIGVHTRNVLEPFHDTWKQVDVDSKKLILE
ncbi:hypothetical protein TIFTF001_033625 [Ficus carica]|uniref:Uncharacterized protein n=1 Tax=Ficus carica TaxID=3494 RepID=A0AA88DYM2_FICCA|nr:hypothetical protein TIFTF001_033625 [Ficus carica]